MTQRQPSIYLPRGFSREKAAEYVGVSASKFDEMVKEGIMPGSKRVGSRRIWDRLALDSHFDELPGHDTVNPWDEADA
ncbi:MAG: hypothetical protein KGO53_14205 [Alphaproteobacteria bacterium]|nr:hypothetical protein [Alphaproteobacteria bacterium]